MEKYYRFAGVEIAVRIPDEVENDEDARLAPFQVDEVKDPHLFEMRKTSTLTPPVGTLVAEPPGMRIYRDEEREIRYLGATLDACDKAYMCVDSLGKQHRIFCLEEKFPDGLRTRLVLNSLGAEHLIARAGGFIFHCSYIERDGEAILFTAPSGTGKSTQADLWHEYRGTEIINGDRAAVRIVDGKVMAEGIPYAGSSPYCKNRSLPICAIVYLSQAKETSIRKLRGYEAFSRIWEGVSVNTWDKQDMELVSAAVQEVARQVSIFHMPCTPDESAVIALEEALRKLEQK